MFKIEVTYQSEIKDVYREEGEIATDENDLYNKLTKTLNTWSDIIIPHIDIVKLLCQMRSLEIVPFNTFGKFFTKTRCTDKLDLQLSLILLHLKMLN